jgi:hypothetical protein
MEKPREAPVIGNWSCKICKSINIASRTECSKCHAPKGATSETYGGGAGRGGSKLCTKDCPPSCPNSKIYIDNLDPSTTEDDLQATFSAIGIIARKKQKRGYPDQWPFDIKIYTTDSGAPKGDAVLKYEDSATAHSALEWFKVLLNFP